MIKAIPTKRTSISELGYLLIIVQPESMPYALGIVQIRLSAKPIHET